MASKKQKDYEEIERWIILFRKYSDEQLRKMINQRFPGTKSNAANRKAFKAVLKERGIDRDDS